jgi:hypothetical protein
MFIHSGSRSPNAGVEVQAHYPQEEAGVHGLRQGRCGAD